MRILLLLLVLTSFFGVTQNVRSTEPENPKFFDINAQGELKQPEGYREWVYVGTALTPDDMNNGRAPFPAFHNVYIDPVSYTYWRNNGRFRDGTILIKERLDVGSKRAVSGRGYFMGNDFIGLEAAIKSKSHFPKEIGNWGYFSFERLKDKSFSPTTSAYPAEDCSACHAAAAAQDLVFTQYYPILTPPSPR